MNEVQREAIARADAKMKPALDRYDLWCEVVRLLCMVPLEDLRELVRLLGILTPDELKDVCGYAQGLAAWRLPAQESKDAEVTQGSPEAQPGSVRDRALWR